MAGRLEKTRPTRRDAVDRARLKLQGDPSHINAREDRLLRETMPEAHGRVVTRGLLAEAGRRGDDRVTKLIPAEAALLKARGGAGTRNPASGLLEFYDSDGPGDGSNTSSAGENTGGMDTSSPNSGVTSDMGPSPSAGGNSGSYAADYGGWSSAGRKARLESRAYDAMKTPIESLLAAPNFAPPGMSFTQYSPRDTGWRFVQELFNPSVKAPGRYGAPNKHGPGIFGDFLSQVTPALSLGPIGVPAFGLGMRVGGAMGRASSPETQAASAREDAARSAHNSSGQQQSHDLNEIDARIAEMRGAEAAGSASGASTAATPPPGYTVNPAGQIVPLAGQQGDNRPAWKDPVQNLLYDYIWRGPSGRGW
jgi:hypothetical protein